MDRRYPALTTVKNMFTVLSENGKIHTEYRKIFQNIARELGIDAQKFNTYYKEWLNDPQQLLLGDTRVENEDIISFMIFACYLSPPATPEQIAKISRFSRLAGFDEQKIKQFLQTTEYIPVNTRILRSVRDIQERLFTRKSHTMRKEREEQEDAFYVANQITKEGIDELQALHLCSRLGLNIALSGPPGTGKTESVLQLSRLLGMHVFTKVCSSRTTESHIIAFPTLVEEHGVTVTAYQNGPLCLAMTTPGIFYGDEFNLLKEDVQKRMNSAFDDRRTIDRNDGVQIKAQDGFTAVISYNPSNNFSMRDLEDSVADRFVHFHYRELVSDLQAYISTTKAKKNVQTDGHAPSDFRIALEKRGISKEGRFLIFEERKWCDFFTHIPVNDVSPDFTYVALITNNFNDRKSRTAIKNLSSKSYGDIELSRLYARFIELINDLATTGKSPLLSKIGLDNLRKKEDLELLSVHKCSTRILTAAIKHFHTFLDYGWNRYLAQSYATSLIINQICYGKYRQQKLRDITNHALVTTIAKALSLYADNKTYNTDFIKKNII